MKFSEEVLLYREERRKTAKERYKATAKRRRDGKAAYKKWVDAGSPDFIGPLPLFDMRMGVMQIGPTHSPLILAGLSVQIVED